MLIYLLISILFCIFILKLYMYFNEIEILEFDYEDGIIIIKIGRLVEDKLTGFRKMIIYHKEIILWQN